MLRTVTGLLTQCSLSCTHQHSASVSLLLSSSPNCRLAPACVIIQEHLQHLTHITWHNTPDTQRIAVAQHNDWDDFYLKACQVTVRHDAVSCLKQCLILLILLMWPVPRFKKLCLKTQKAKNIVKANVQLCSLKAKRLPRVLQFEFSPSNFGTNLGTNTRLFTFYCYYYHPFVPFILNYEPGQSLHANKVKSFDFSSGIWLNVPTQVCYFSLMNTNVLLLHYIVAVKASTLFYWHSANLFFSS